MTFYVPEDVTMIGGWLGNEPPNGDPMGAPENTILSGDLGVLGDSQDNCYHVVVPQVIKGTAPSTVKRFLIVDGNANGTGANNEDMGGGILCLGASVVLDQLTIRDNFAEIGGGIAISSVFDPDQGTNEQTDLKMKRCTLRSNLASAKGGAFYAFESGAIEVVNCRFRNNGGGVLDGGAIALDKKIHDTRFVNCLIYDNTARRYGGGIWADYPDCNGCGFFFINCTVAFNVVTDPAPFSHGAGLYVMGGNTANNVGYGAVNTILWKNPGTANNENLYVDGIAAGDAFEITHSCVGARATMPGNITAGGNGFLDNVDPMFQNEANRNFRLRLLSPCINAGDDDNLVPDFTDIDEDGNTTVEKVPLEFFIIAADLLDKNDSTREVDHGGEPQPQPLVGIDAGNMVGRICDIGAFEYRIYPR